MKLKENAKASTEKAAAISLTSGMWTSNTDTYLAVTCYFVDDCSRLHTVYLGVQHFPKVHTAKNIAQVTISLMRLHAL